MRITDKFLKLTKYTYPHGTESQLLSYLPKNYKEDGFGNFYYEIGDSSTMFTCHLDTADHKQKKVTHVFTDNIISTDGKSILGADDKAGMTVLLYMISKRVPGLYYFFIGEEVGCVGSIKLSSNWGKTKFSKYINKVVSFDRRGTKSVITHQLYGRCCSDEFAQELANRLNLSNRKISMVTDNTGIMTDSASFVSLVPECTNISVGYYKEHTIGEHQDIEFLKNICHASSKIDWETLPIKRDPKRFNNNLYTEDPEWLDDNWTWVRDVDGEVKKAYISTKQIELDLDILIKYVQLKYGDENVLDVKWDGRRLWYKNTNDVLKLVSERIDLIKELPEIGRITISSLRFNNIKIIDRHF